MLAGLRFNCYIELGGISAFYWMWLLLVTGRYQGNYQSAPQSLLSGCCTRFQAIPAEARACSQLPFPGRLGRAYCGSGAGSPGRTCAVSPGWTIRIKGPKAQSTAGVVAGGMSWWKPDEVLHQEQNNSQLAGCPVDGRQLERTGSTWIPASIEWILLQHLCHRGGDSMSIENWNGWPKRLQNLVL